MSIYNQLYDFQKNIVDKFKERKSFGLFLDMGLGKTPLALAFAEVNKCTKVIVITINGKACETINDNGSWFAWASKSSIKYELKNKYTKTFSSSPEIFVLNYESLFERGKNKAQRVTLKQTLQDFIFKCSQHRVAVIIDESHKMKNLQSQQTLAIIELKKRLQRCAKDVYSYLLTGTPFTTGYIDLYAQLKFLGCEMTKGDFVDLFCIRGNIPGLLGWQQPIVGYKNVNGLFNLIHQYAITVKTEDVITLPEKIFTYHITNESEEFIFYTSEKANGLKISEFANKHAVKLNDPRYLLNKTVNNPFFRDIDYPDSKWLAETSGQCWLRARQLSIGFNGNASNSVWFDRSRLELLKYFLEWNKNNYVLFYNYTPEMLEIYDICEELGYNIDVYCGEIKSLTHYQEYCNLDEGEKLITHNNIILANFTSGSTGLNWQEYNHCIIFSCPIFKDYAQGIKRIHRTGQKKTTFYHIFYQNNWLDKSMNEALQQCKDYDSKMFESDLQRVQTIISGD